MPEERVALVTGASSGIGRAIARWFGRRRLRVGLVARRADRLEAVAADLRADGGGALVLPGDVREPSAADRSVEAVVKEWGRLDLLVNNAGIGRRVGAAEVTDELLRAQFETNVFAPFHFTRAAVPHMKRQGGGQIVNIGSMAGYVGVANHSVYSATKWALRGMNNSWREELYPDGIKVAYVGPGFVIAEFAGRKEDPSVPEAEWALTVDDVAHAVQTIADQGPNSDIREIVIQVRDRS